MAFSKSSRSWEATDWMIQVVSCSFEQIQDLGDLDAGNPAVIKKRKYDEDYIKYGFTVMEKKGIDHPQCIVWHAVLSNDALRPSCLEQHLTKNHSALKDKPKEFFAAKLQNLKCMKLDTTGTFHQASAKVVEASYELSLLIAKAKEVHMIGETLVKPCLLKAADIVLGAKGKKKILEISLSDNSMKRHINDMVKDLKL
ncbi:unnamed protein product [Caretta caretta]